MEKGAQVNTLDRDHTTPLHTASMEGDKDIVRLLLKNGAQVNAVNIYGRTPLHDAVEIGHKAIVKLLLKNEAQVNTVDIYDRTPLHYAAEGKHEELTKLLIAAWLEKNPSAAIPDFAAENRYVCRIWYKVAIELKTNEANMSEQSSVNLHGSFFSDMDSLATDHPQNELRRATLGR